MAVLALSWSSGAWLNVGVHWRLHSVLAALLAHVASVDLGMLLVNASRALSQTYRCMDRMQSLLRVIKGEPAPYKVMGLALLHTKFASRLSANKTDKYHQSSSHISLCVCVGVLLCE